MNLNSIAHKSIVFGLGSIVLFTACGKKNDDKKTDEANISQPYQKKTQILSDAHGGTNSIKIACSADKKFVSMNLTDTVRFEGTYNKGTVQFSKFVEHDSQGKEKESQLNQAGIKQLCDEYTNEKNGFSPGEITYVFTSCKDTSNKEYKLTSTTVVTGDALWCNKK